MTWYVASRVTVNLEKSGLAGKVLYCEPVIVKGNTGRAVPLDERWKDDVLGRTRLSAV